MKYQITQLYETHDETLGKDTYTDSLQFLVLLLKRQIVKLTFLHLETYEEKCNNRNN